MLEGLENNIRSMLSPAEDPLPPEIEELVNKAEATSIAKTTKEHNELTVLPDCTVRHLMEDSVELKSYTTPSGANPMRIIVKLCMAKPVNDEESLHCYLVLKITFVGQHSYRIIEQKGWTTSNITTAVKEFDRLWKESEASHGKAE